MAKTLRPSPHGGKAKYPTKTAKKEKGEGQESDVTMPGSLKPPV
ncbi:hypothetical protein [Pyruvatibacter sp.]